MAQGIPGSVGYQPDCLTCRDTGYSDSCLGHKLCPAKCQAGFKAADEIGDTTYRSYPHIFLTEDQKLEETKQDGDVTDLGNWAMDNMVTAQDEIVL
jgi:hypothetical protein